MAEASFYPTDYDSIHAGSPGQDNSNLMMSFFWGGLLSAKNPAATIPQAQLNLLNACSGPNSIGGSAPPVTINAERDVLAAWQARVEDGIPPAKLISTKYVNDRPAQGVLRELPPCPYPQVIHYRGGNETLASSYDRVADDTAFAKDVTQELKNVETDALIGDLANLPN